MSRIEDFLDTTLDIRIWKNKRSMNIQKTIVGDKAIVMTGFYSVFTTLVDSGAIKIKDIYRIADDVKTDYYKERNKSNGYRQTKKK